MWYVRDVLYAVLYVRVSCFVVRGCGVSRRYIYVCYCDMFSVVNVYLDHLKFCVVCINSRRYVCCSECDIVPNRSHLIHPGPPSSRPRVFMESSQLYAATLTHYSTEPLTTGPDYDPLPLPLAQVGDVHPNPGPPRYA